MIQEIAPQVYHLEYQVKEPAAAGKVFCFREGCVLLTRERRVPLRAQLGDCPIRYRYLFAIDREEYYLGEPLGPVQVPGLEWMPRRVLRGLEPLSQAFAGYTARHLEHWYRDNRFCGRCGAKMEKSTTERAMVCPQCKNTVYPKICPAVIVAVHDGDRLLLTRYRGRPFKKYALIAGFNEIGETIEQTVHREVLEEAGVRVKNLRFYKSQPWVFTDTLLMGFVCELDGSDRITVQESELAEASWHLRSELPQDHSYISLTGEMIEQFRLGKL